MDFIESYINFDYWWIKLWIIALLTVIVTLIAFKNLWLASDGRLRSHKIGVGIVIAFYAIFLVSLMFRIIYLVNASQDKLSPAGGIGDGVVLAVFIGPIYCLMFSYLSALRKIKNGITVDAVVIRADYKNQEDGHKVSIVCQYTIAGNDYETSYSFFFVYVPYL